MEGLYVTGQVNNETLQAEQTGCVCVLGAGLYGGGGGGGV